MLRHCAVRIERSRLSSGVGALAIALGACAPSSPAVAPVELQGSPSSLPTPVASAAPNTREPEPPEVVTPEGMVMRDVRIGHGALAENGSRVKVHYVGTLTDGREFDNSHDRGSAFEFAVGRGQVIRGWDEGVRGMRVGGVRRLRVPPDLAYGDRAMGTKIPARATLIFEIELLDVAR